MSVAFPNIDPVALQLGPVAIHWYGISYVVGMLLAWWLLAQRARQAGAPLNTQQLSDLMFVAMLGVVIGGRLGSILFYHLGDLRQDIWMPLRIWQGGMSFHGGLLGVLLACYLFARRQRLGFFTVSDFLAPAVPVGLFLGRIANFINGELWGKPTDMPWGVVFPSPLAGAVARHPSQLYQAALEGLVLFVILWCYSARPRSVRAVSGLFLLGYGVARFAVEFVREPDRHIGYIAGGWLTLGQVLSLPMVFFGLLLLGLAWRSASREGAPA